ncbi:MAG: RDD family protein, partial [Acidobacteriota bacterium]|nr:RDD family protein [Acidobacteriota bacterium]
EIWTTLYFVVVVILYHSLLESWLGQTPGKRVAGIRVARPGGSPAGAVRAVGRNIFKLLSLFVLGLGFVIAAFTRQRRALHDMLGGTLVVDQGAVPASVTASGKTMKSSPVVLLFALAATAVVLTTPIMALDRLIQRQTVYRDARVPIGVDELGTRSPEEPSRLVVPFTRMQGNVDSHRVILESAAGAGRSDLVGR